MKTKIFLVLLIMLGVSVGEKFAQSNTETNGAKLESPYDEYKLRFALDADPSPEAVGFDDPKSYWKFSYELRFVENPRIALEKVGYKNFRENQNESQSERSKRIEKSNKQYNKAYKKYGIRVAKGKISKVGLLSEENRDINFSVPLSTEIKNILAQSESKNTLPDFWIQVKGKIYSKTKIGLQFKHKFQTSYVCSAKSVINRKSEWMMNSCGVYQEVMRENANIRIGRSSRL